MHVDEGVVEDVEHVARAANARASDVHQPGARELVHFARDVELEEAELAVVSTLKGTPAKKLRFRYYAPVPNSPVAGYSPLAYTLHAGRTLLAEGRRKALTQWLAAMPAEDR